MISSLNPFDYKDLFKAHGVMMNALVDNAGKFRSGGVGCLKVANVFILLLLQTVCRF